MEKKLNEAINELALQYNPSEELKEMVLKKVMRKKSHSKTKVYLSVAIIALSIPLFAFIKQYFYADQLFGSYEQVENSTMTMSFEDYKRVDNKISHALRILSPKDGVQFISGVSGVIQFKLQYANENGAINQFELSDEQYQKYYDIVASIQPYFDILNGLNSSKDVLSEEEFRQYIEATILNESITAASNVGYEDYDYSRVAPEYIEQNENVEETLALLESKLSKRVIIDGVDYTMP